MVLNAVSAGDVTLIFFLNLTVTLNIYAEF